MSSNTEMKYRTRFNVTEMTAKEAAIELLDRAKERLNFLTHTFDHLHFGGDGFSLPEYTSKGLSCILEDISRDVWEVQTYIEGDEPTPGRSFDTVFAMLQAAKGKEASHE